MYRKDHIALAKSVRDAAVNTGITMEQTVQFAAAIADVCESRTPASANFDREMFMAYALSPKSGA